MAKIKIGAIVTDISGKLGGHVFAKNKGGNYMRTKVVPSNPQTAAQQAVRNLFSSISSAWSGLTESQRSSWRGAVSQFATTDIFGDLRNPTGKALFQRLNQNLAISEQTQLDEAPNPAPITGLIPDGSTAAVGTSAFGIDTLGDATGSKVLVFATEPLSQGTKFVKNKLRLISVVAGGTDATLDVATEYADKFGGLTAGDNVYIGVKVCNTVGQTSPMATQKVIVSA